VVHASQRPAPAYEWDFSDVNPPVHAWAALRIYQIEQKHYGRADRDFLERIFQKLLINFTWWVNRKDSEDRNIFEGGFLGLDNISVFDRSAALPGGGRLEQADGTSGMAMYCLNLLGLALELAKDDRVYEDVATKFFEHFVYIGSAINKIGGQGLWSVSDGYYYDQVRLPDGRSIPIKANTISGSFHCLPWPSAMEKPLQDSAISRGGCSGSRSTGPSSWRDSAT
jgi:hypothetical protein